MGQYYEIVNVDKREVIKPHALGCGAKLEANASSFSAFSLALLNKLAGDWKGDRVYVVGDYANYICEEDPYCNTLQQAFEELGTDNLYDYADEQFKNVSKECDTVNRGWRYVYNHAVHRMIDLNDYTLDWCWFDTKTVMGSVSILAPLTLLLTMGNGRGGGDFHGRGTELVGSWCNSVQDIEIRRTEIPDCQLPRPVKGSGLAKGPCPLWYQRIVAHPSGPDVYTRRHISQTALLRVSLGTEDCVHIAGLLT